MDRESIILPSLKFPQKLWHIINKCETGAISWSSTGSTILLHYKKFQDEYLSCPDKIFKTNNITSFIRQLNMYGFRKVASHKSEVWNIHSQNVHEFMHEYFQCGRMDLLEKVCRKTGTRTNKMENIGEDDLKMEIRDEEFSNTVLELPMTKLQTCQMALKNALHHAVIQYEAHRTREFLEESNNFDHEEFKFYFVRAWNSFKNDLETITLYVPKITDTENRDWYSEALMGILTNNY